MLKKLLSETVIYGASSVGARLLNYLLIALHTDKRYGFATEEYGILSVLYAYVAFLNIVYTYGMETSFFRFASKDKTHQTFNLILTNILGTTLVISGILLFLSGNIASILDYPDKQNFIIWLILIISIDTLLVIPYAQLRLENKAKQFALTKIINIALNIFLNLFFLIFCKEVYEGNWFPSLKPLIAYIYYPQIGIGYVFLANLLSNAFVFLLLYKTLLKFRLYWSWQKFKPIFWYGFPLLFMGLAGIANETLDRILLKYLLPTDFYTGESTEGAIGVYSGVYKLAIFMTLSVQAFKYAAEPFFFSKAEDKKAPELFSRVMRYLVICLMVIFLGVSLNLDIFKILLRQESYHAGLAVVPILLLANAFLGIYYNLSVWYKLTDKTYFGTILAIIGATVTLISNILLIPVLGYTGSALATLFAYFSMTLFSYVLGQKHFFIPYQLKVALFDISFAVVLVLIATYWIKIEGFWLKFLFQNALLVFYLGIIFLRERRKLKL